MVSLAKLSEENIILYDQLRSNISKIYKICKKESKQESTANDIESMKENLSKLENFIYSMYINFYNEAENILDNLKLNGIKVLENIPSNLKDNKAFFCQAILINSQSLKYASENLKNNYEFIDSLIEKKPMILNYVSERLKDNRQLVDKAINKDGWAILCASDNIRKDINYAMIAVKNSYSAIQCLDDNLRDNEQIVITACEGENKEIMMEHASQRLKEDSNFFQKMIAINPMTLDYFCDKFKADQEKVLLAMSFDYNTFKFASPKLKKDKIFIKRAIKEIKNIDNSFHQLLDDEIKNDIEIILSFLDNGSNIEIKEDLKHKILDIFC